MNVCVLENYAYFIVYGQAIFRSGRIVRCEPITYEVTGLVALVGCRFFFYALNGDSVSIFACNCFDFIIACYDINFESSEFTLLYAVRNAIYEKFYFVAV